MPRFSRGRSPIAVLIHSCAGLVAGLMIRIGHGVAHVIESMEVLGLRLARVLTEACMLIFDVFLRRPWQWLEAVAGMLEWSLGALHAATDAVATMAERLYAVMYGLVDPFVMLAMAALRGCKQILDLPALPVLTGLAACRQPVDRVIDWCERLFANVTSFATELFELLSQMLLWMPVKLAFRMLNALLAMVWRGPVGAALRWLVRLLIPAKIRRRILRSQLASGPFLTIRSSVAGFVDSWIASRDYKKLAWSLPALAMMTCIAIPMVLVQAYSPGDHIVHYRSTLRTAIADDDEPRIELALARLRQLGDRQQERQLYAIAIAGEKNDGPQAVYEQMRTLAESEDGGLRDAKLWLAYNLLSGTVKSDHKSSLEYARELVAECCIHSGEDNHTQFLNAEITYRTEGLSRGIEAFEAIRARGGGEVRARLMQLCTLAGDWERAATHAEYVADVIRMQKNRPSSPEINLRLVDALAICRKWDDLPVALDSVESQLSPKSGRAQLIVEHLLDTEPELTAQQAQTLYRMAWKSPRLNRYVGEYLGEALKDAKPSSRSNAKTSASPTAPNSANQPAATDMQDFVDRQLQLGHVDSLAFRCAGDVAYGNNEISAALRMYQQAVQLDPRDATSWNNAAWLQYSMDDLEMALQAATRAVELKADANYLETRGLILARLERWPEAIVDLERALNGDLPNGGSECHLALSKAYTSVGKFEMAAAHRSRTNH